MERRRHEESPQIRMPSHGFGPDYLGIERNGLPIRRRRSVERNSDNVRNIPPPSDQVGGMVRRHDTEGVRTVDGGSSWHGGNIAFSGRRGGFQ